MCETYDLGGNLQSAREEPSVQLLPSAGIPMLGINQNHGYQSNTL
jgi:hypothetical protein